MKYVVYIIKKYLKNSFNFLNYIYMKKNFTFLIIHVYLIQTVKFKFIFFIKLG